MRNQVRVNHQHSPNPHRSQLQKLTRLEDGFDKGGLS
jgi:hypothetical protein